MKNFLIWGDSITYGHGDADGGWVGRLRKTVWKDSIVYNLGISGDTTTEVLGRLEFEARQRIDPEEETVCIFAIGINDSIFLSDRGTFQTELPQFVKNIHEIYSQAKRISSRIVFVGLTPVDEKKTNPISWAPNKVYKNDFIEKYHSALRTFCGETQLPFVDVFSSWEKLQYMEWLYDGVHPNANGYDALFSEISSTLTEHQFLP